MAQITFTLSAAHLQRVLDALGRNYRPTFRDGTPNPQTKAEFARARIVQWIKDETIRQEQVAAREAAPTPAEVEIV